MKISFNNSIEKWILDILLRKINTHKRLRSTYLMYLHNNICKVKNQRFYFKVVSLKKFRA